ncbi:AzlC family ABC transporter permease [Acuticoccus sp. M5D2P5]|uniref:AzlC family ABC transporter permease n=1 Tax=Acuticoccus kalidii TaxID=2910977 RepID=UPI001F3EDE9A|nr:AzlC family ABC transporter permease [Acuticoccus kalidii]MCF3932152.1 AzlC family ABC transporter permease [Acuticoccus kalidii]
MNVLNSQSTTLTDFRRGAALSLPLLAAIVPLSALFGAVAIGNGLTPFDAVLMSMLLFAGASQFVAVDLFGQDVPAWSILLSVLALNFRHVLYSAALTPVFRPLKWSAKLPLFALLVDPVFAITEKRTAEGKAFSVPLYLGLALSLYAMWQLGTFLGAVSGSLIEDPRTFALDMFLPIYFLTIVMSFRTRPNWAPTVLVSGLLSILVYYAPQFGLTFLGPPWHITIGAIGGIVTAVLLATPKGPGRSAERAADHAASPALQPAKCSS